MCAPVPAPLPQPRMTRAGGTSDILPTVLIFEVLLGNSKMFLNLEKWRLSILARNLRRGIFHLNRMPPLL